MKNRFAQNSAHYIGPEETRDVWLATAAGDGDTNAQRELAERLFDRVRRTMSYLMVGTEAEDLAQMALIQVLHSAGSFRGECTLEYWADRIITRVFFRYRGKLKRRRDLWEKEMRSMPVQDTGDDAFEMQQVRCRISAMLNRLSKKHRATIVLRYLSGYTVEEVATIEDVSINTVRGRIRTARKKLTELMETDPLLEEWMSGRMS